MRFTPAERYKIREDLLADAASDLRISGAAITGSVAAGREDQWSDIDLAFGVREGSDVSEVLADWTRKMIEGYGAVDTHDVAVGAWIYRVFLLPSTLQVDLAFTTSEEFRPLAPTFELVYGEAKEAGSFGAPSTKGIIGMGWLYALHSRSSLERGKLWQAEFMVSSLRDQTLMLAAVRHGLPSAHARGVDALPEAVKRRFGATLIGSLDSVEVRRAFMATMGLFAQEVRAAAPELAERLVPVLLELAQLTQN